MKRIVLGSAVAVIAVAAFLASPFVGLARLQSAVEARNAAALSDRVDFARVRRSLGAQIVATYLQISGKSARLGEFGTLLATNLGASLADPLLNELINPERMLDLLGGPGIASPQVQPGPVALPKDALGSLWQAFANSEYGVGNFYISVPTNAVPPDQFRLRLQVLQWNWKLTEIDLPERVRIELAKELQRRIG
jgi:hypothetical protein